MTSRLLASTGRHASKGEERSWKVSIPQLAADLQQAGLGDVEMLIEYQLPLSSKRVDVVLAGTHPTTGRNSYIAVELKQWDHADSYEDDPILVRVGAYGDRPVLHPLEQVRGYSEYMMDFLPGLLESDSTLKAVAYLHNATERGVLDLRDYESTQDLRLYTGETKQAFFDFLKENLDAGGNAETAADALVSGRVAPSRQLLAVAATEVQERKQFTLLAEQRLAYELVLHEVEKARAADSKSVIVVTGGPGSGKSVIALSLLGELARRGRTVLHATGSKSFTTTLRKVAGRRAPRVSSMFKYFNSFMTTERNSLDVLILDEAHRIRETSINRYTKKELRGERPQIDELMAAARVPVFLLDQHQVVRPGELGTVEDIQNHARKLGLPVQVIELDFQFRCGGSESYINWVERLLGLKASGPVIWTPETSFSLQIVDSPVEMEVLLSERIAEGYAARMTAGYCWPWSDAVPGEPLVDDVKIGGWSKPWNLKGDRSLNGAPPAPLWATDPAGFGQVGCVYTAQGFEYDWNGVIFGPDLVIRDGQWVAVRTANRDPDFKSAKKVSDEEFDRLVRNVYKVLLTRGMMGTLIYSVDAETQRFLRAWTMK